jgi:hypothetical protein
VLEVVVERLDGVERVLGERERARRGRRPGVDERRLDDVVALGRRTCTASSTTCGPGDEVQPAAVGGTTA